MQMRLLIESNSRELHKSDFLQVDADAGAHN